MYNKYKNHVFMLFMKDGCLRLLLASLLFFTISCEKIVAKEELLKEITISACEYVLNSPLHPQDAKERAVDVIKAWENDVIDSDPRLVYVSYFDYVNYIDYDKFVKDPNKYVLHVIMSDENYDIAGIGIKEAHILADGRHDIIEDIYPIVGRIGHPQIFTFKKRDNKNFKDEKAWEKYIEKGVRDPENEPDIWISIPIPGKIEVEIWIYDHQGHKSKLLPLENLWN
ncbi:hypothetical protein ACFL02_03615 [Planctomycetota bacterium]